VASGRTPHLGISICCAGLCWLALAAQAAEPKDPQQAGAELSELRTRIDALQVQLKASRAQESDLTQEVREVEQRIGKLNTGVREIEAQVHAGERQLEALQGRYAESITKLELERRELAKQLRAAYLLGRQEQVKLALNQEDPARFGRMLVYYRYLNQARLTRIQAFEVTLTEIDTLQQQIDAQRATLTETQSRQAVEVAVLDEERQRRASLLGALQMEIRAKGGELSQMQKDEKRLGQLIKDLQRALAEVAPKDVSKADAPRRPFAKLKRKLPWPVTGKLAAGFGDRREVGDLRWRGAFIAASANRDVRAVAHGRVVFADWLRGFGLLIIIDHGDEYMTLYGHNQALYKAAGERVAPGDVVASVGDTGGMDRSGVYFELRHKGEPQNPQNWCAGTPDAAQAKR
jgi:septal ring factor EnvC (AmiA/AmiB activator)